MSLPGYEKLELAGVVDATAAQLVQLVLDAVKSGKKKASRGCQLVRAVGQVERGMPQRS